MRFCGVLTQIWFPTRGNQILLRSENALHLRSAFLTAPDFAQKTWILQNPLQSRRDDMFIAAFSSKNLSPVRAACLYLQLLKRCQFKKKLWAKSIRPGRCGFAVYSPKFCPHAAKFVFALHLRSAFLTAPELSQKLCIFSTLFSPVGFICLGVSSACL